MCVHVLRLGGVACVLAALAVLALAHADSVPHLSVYGALAPLAVASAARRAYVPASCARGLCFGALLTALAAAAVAHALLALEAPPLHACRPPAELAGALAAAAATAAHWREARDWAALTAVLALVAGTRVLLEVRASAASVVEFVETERPPRRVHARAPARRTRAAESEGGEEMESIDLA